MIVLITQLNEMHANEIDQRSNHQASPKGGEIRIPMGKTHAPKIKNFISYYKKEKTMKSSLKSKEILTIWLQTIDLSKLKSSAI